MKALSVAQPFASLIAEGYKTIEVRSWTTDYRGALLIVASTSRKVAMEQPDGTNQVLPMGMP